MDAFLEQHWQTSKLTNKQTNKQTNTQIKQTPTCELLQAQVVLPVSAWHAEMAVLSQRSVEVLRRIGVPCVLFRAILFVAATAAFARDLDLARALFLRSSFALVLTTLGSEYYGIARATCFLEIVFKLII